MVSFYRFFFFCPAGPIFFRGSHFSYGIAGLHLVHGGREKRREAPQHPPQPYHAVPCGFNLWKWCKWESGLGVTPSSGFGRHPFGTRFGTFLMSKSHGFWRTMSHVFGWFVRGFWQVCERFLRLGWGSPNVIWLTTCQRHLGAENFVRHFPRGLQGFWGWFVGLFL